MMSVEDDRTLRADAGTASALLAATCPPPFRDPDRVVLGHGSGGRLTAELIEHMFLPALRNPALDELDDHATLTLGGGLRLAFTTDSYVVSPRFFPGGDIGELAVNGTINDLAVGGARPLGLSLAFILEEGLSLRELARVVESVRRAATRANVPVVTGDTKVVGRGQGDGLFINTSGVGVIPEGISLGSARVRDGDAVLVSGSLGDHGMTILAAREKLELGGDLASDTASLHGLCNALLAVCPETHAMRDATRGGLGAVLVEIAARRQLGITVEEESLPVRESVRGACELFGLDPMLVANEGKLVAFVPAARAAAALSAMRGHPLGEHAACIGKVTTERPGTVVVRTAFGGSRVVDLPLSEPLPRIC